MSKSSVRVSAGQVLEPFIAAGGIVVLGPGVHRGGITIENSVDIVGEPGAILDADRQGPVIHLAVDEIEVNIRDLVIRGGAGEAGGGLRNTGRSEVTFTQCSFEDNEATLAGSGVGGGLWSSRGKITLTDCRFSGNRARSGSDIYVTNVAWVTMTGGSVAGDAYIGEGARFDATAVRIHGRLSARGTTTRAPVVTLRGTQVDGGIENDANLPASFVVEDG